LSSQLKEQILSREHLRLTPTPLCFGDFVRSVQCGLRELFLKSTFIDEIRGKIGFELLLLWAS
jgi:hypothetical protein